MTYNGGPRYAPADKNNTFFMVNPTDKWDMIINGDYKPYGENSTITVTLPSDVRAKNVTIMIDGVSYVRNVVGNVATLTLNNLSAGVHIANVSYAGNVNYSAKVKEFTPVIPKAVSIFTDLIAIVTGPNGENISGNVTFRLNKGIYTINITGNNATLHDKLVIGDNYVYIGYNGNENYTTAEHTDIYTVGKFNTTIIVNATNITYGQVEVINVTVNSTAEGFIALRIGTQIFSSYIVNGTAQFNITGLPTGTYTANVTFFPTVDSKFNGNVTNVTFRVDPTTDYSIEVRVNDIEYGDVARIAVLVPTDAVGNVTIYVDGNFKGNVTLKNGVAVLDNIAGLAGGQHVVNVTYNGDSRYAPKDKNNTSFMVNPTNNWDMSITVGHVNYC